MARDSLPLWEGGLGLRHTLRMRAEVTFPDPLTWDVIAKAPWARHAGFVNQAKEPAMSAYAVARLTDVAMGPEIVEYLKRIDATLEPFNGHFLIHGGPVERLEGAWSGDLIMIGFPNMKSARAW